MSGVWQARRVEVDAWDEIAVAIDAAPYPVRVLPGDVKRAAECLAFLEITTRSWLGAVVARSGGLLVDHGWLRVLGSGHDGLPDVGEEADRERGGLVVAHDVLGGHFAWIPAEPGVRPTIHHYGADTVEWQDLEIGYADWLHAMLTGATTEFYASLRWPGWEAEVEAVPVDRGIHAYPPPFTVEGADLSAVSRAPVPWGELMAFNEMMMGQLSDDEEE
jgi:hypothetical protein